MKPAWQQHLEQAWLSKTHPLSLALLPISWIYSAIRSARAFAYTRGWFDAYTAPVPTLVIGSVVVGGTGKTPIVIETVRYLQSKGLRVGVVSRGYGRRDVDTMQLVTNSSLAHEVGDEPLLIAQKTQAVVCVGRSRPKAIAHLLQHAKVDCIISDDGLQHYAMARQAEIIVFDERMSGNGRLLPAGLLREPWPRRLVKQKSAHHLESHILAPEDASIQLDTIPPKRLSGVTRKLSFYANNRLGGTKALAAWQGTSVSAIAGIAQPSNFFNALKEQGLQLDTVLAATDHADYSQPEWLERIDALPKPVLCTEKDAVKLHALGVECWAVPLEVDLSESFYRYLDRFISEVGETEWPVREESNPRPTA